MQKRISFIAVLFIFISSAVMAQSQNGTIKGFVYDKKTGEPMIYTNVLFKGVKIGAQTDINGYFSISLPAGSYTMFATNIGYDTASADVNLLPGAVITKKLTIGATDRQLKGVEVSARQTEKITHINTGVTTITPREIKLLPSAGGEPDVAQYLQVVPGVVFTGDQGGQLYIRGGSEAQTGIYLDGVTIWNPFHSIGLYSVFETEAIRNVDVYTGGFDAQYGNRTSAIIDVHTKDGNKNELAGIVSLSPIMSRALLEGPLYKSKKNGSSISFLVTGKYSWLDQTSKTIYSGLGQPFSNGLDYNFTDLFGKLTFSADNGSKLNLFGFSYDDKASLADSVLQGATETPRTSEYHWHVNGGGGTFVVSPGSSSALIDGKFAYSKYTVGLDQVAVDPQPKSSEIDDFEAAINFSYFLPGYSELRYGIEVSGYHTQLAYNIAPGDSTSENRESTLAGVYLLYRKNFGDKLIIEPSIRFEYFSEISKVSPEPRLGIKYNISDKVRLKASGGIYAQNVISTKNDVDIVNLFTGFILTPDETVYNNSGQPVSTDLQNAYHIITGLEVDVNSNTEINFEPWYKYFPQIFELNPDKVYASQPDFVSGSGKAYGVDLSVKYYFNRINFLGVIGYQEVEYTTITSDGSVQTYPAPFDAAVNMNLVASYLGGKKRDWNVSVRFNLRSPFPFTQTQGFYENQSVNNIYTNLLQQNGTTGIIYSSMVDGGTLSYYHRLDLSAGKTFRVSKKTSLDGTFSITNVYDRQNIFYVDRFTNVRVYQLPIFPSVNVTLHF